jgi:hypothetical protein
VPLCGRILTGIINVKKTGGALNARTSLAGQTDHPHYGWRCPRY